MAHVLPVGSYTFVATDSYIRFVFVVSNFMAITALMLDGSMAHELHFAPLQADERLTFRVDARLICFASRLQHQHPYDGDNDGGVGILGISPRNRLPACSR